MTQELKNQNQATEQKQNVVAVEENINHGLESESQSPTEINTEISIDDSAVNKLKNQISFSTKALEQQQKELSGILSSSAKQLNNAVKTFDRIITDQQKQYVILQNEVGVLTVLPEQLKKEIKNIIPDMAKHIDAVYQEKLQALNNAHNDTVAANKELTSVLDQKLDEYSKKLSDSASYVTQCSNTSFLKNMCLVVLFSAIISGVTSYLVTTKFPRHFNVTGASSVTIYDSNVHVLGGKPVNKEHANNKNTKK
jgi:small-conductance mechanosensitive channel